MASPLYMTVWRAMTFSKVKPDEEPAMMIPMVYGREQFQLASVSWTLEAPWYLARLWSTIWITYLFIKNVFTKSLDVRKTLNMMETFSALLALCAGNSAVTGEFPTQRSVTRSFDVCFALHLPKRLIKQLWRRCFETPLYTLWRHCNWHMYISALCSLLASAGMVVTKSSPLPSQHMT